MKKYFKLFFTFFSAFLLASCVRISSTSVSQVSAPNTSNKMALRIYKELPVYAQAAKMQWKPIQMNVPMKIGKHDNHIPIIRARLIALHFLPAGDDQNTLFNSQLSHAISQFQFCNGLNQTGVIDQATLNALNITPAQRYNELVRSMNDWAKYPEDANSRYVQVNIPSYTMHLVSHGENILHMRVIVGRPSRPTPTMTSKITTIVFNPTWTVPKTILSRDVIPGMRENPNYLKEHYDMRVYANYEKNAPEINPSTINWQTATLSTFPYRVTAPASDVNPLGRIKFIFENDQDIYMHGTPDTALFAQHYRAKSSGCIRLENPMALVEYFYVDNNDLNAELVNQYLSTRETKYIQLRNPMPVYITYIPAWIDNDGHAHFSQNIYDRSGASANTESTDTFNDGNFFGNVYF
ncbi:MAG TPA: L,D-transpeptidase family protein [Coxiellaceae bacterium]|nr:MAG: hypothetical protein A3E81_03555 [Gammaproteobacteria bacterium RIFCSPHIGHO2_12_FULL_36_30]HLB56322.1 L,D-transpeptidase family protein [Coxiellaceae bacterium]